MARSSNTLIPAQSAPDSQANSTRGLAVRRWFLVGCPVLAGAFAIAGAAADPAAGIDGRQLFSLYADDPERLQFKSLGFHWAFAFWLAPPLLIAGYIRDRGVWLANIAAILGFVGMTTLPGLLISDFYDSAIGQTAGIDATAEVSEVIGGMWGLTVLAVPGFIGLIFGLPLAAAAAWGSGIIRWWAPVAVVAGTLVFMLSKIMWWDCVVTTACFAVFLFALEKGTRPA